ncbi:hypothetical protein [Lyngbya sp. PCC 8106]|uniref:hypothetical protein n=1 Tax=Lyngbya sp. (strain PCC 8106) TaxID=313612 RepID=UPI0000EAAB1D|nr:hypothetical protein [Lyngbya sp. PCC 8106]EAW33633.1 hypothetical protein L8106_17942 [Lyngbya sp. PCC 8106]
MRRRIKILSFTVATTIALLLVGATLVVLGIFDEILNWDIFSAKVEAVLTGIFWASVVLSIFGVAITFVLGIQEIVRAIGSLQRYPDLESSSVVPEAPKTTYLLYMVGLVSVFSALIAALSVINNRITVHRSQVFKEIAAKQMEKLQTKWVQQVSQITTPPRNNVPISLNELIQSVVKLSFVNNMILYLPDTEDQTVIWSYNSWGTYKKENGFERTFVAKEYEQAIQATFLGRPELLQVINDRTGFTWYYVVKNPQDQTMAILKINGNAQENFREYRLDSESN